MRMLTAMTCAAPSRSPWPNRCASSTVVPMDRPVTAPVMICIVWLPVDTAEMSAAVPNVPAAQRSTAP